MTDVARTLMTGDAFLDWSMEQVDRYELVDGRPVLKFDNGPDLMAGATRRHDQIVVNIIAALRPRLRGGPCAPSTSDQAARMRSGNIRRPDVTIDCGPVVPTSTESLEPAVFFEVLSPSTRGLDLVLKSNEYQQLPSLKHYVMLEPDRAFALIWTRAGDGSWPPAEAVSGLDGSLDLGGVGATLSMAEVYEDVVPAEI